MMKKYELTSEFKIDNLGTKLFRIKALVDIESCGVKACDLGGFIEKEDNLSHEGNAWVYGNAQVYGNASISDDALVSGNASISGDACVNGDDDYATIKGFGTMYRTTTFFRCVDKEVRVICGCFYGTIEEFRNQVKETRTGKVANEYLKIADLMEEHFCV